MSLARAFTTRRANRNTAEMSSVPQRSNSTKPSMGYSMSIRNKISAPMELTHTTNMLAYNAPDLYPQSASSTASTRSEDDSETNASSPPTSPDVDFAEEMSAKAHHNHLSCDFTLPGQQTHFAQKAPAVPRRAPSRNRQPSYESSQHRSRNSQQSNKSASTKASFTLSRSSSASTTATTATAHSTSGSFSSKPSVPSLPPASEITSQPSMRPVQSHHKPAERHDSQHPFGSELARVTELAEDFGIKDKMTAEEQEVHDLTSKGLCIFRPEEYLADIQSIFSTFFRPEPAHVEMQEPAWI